MKENKTLRALVAENPMLLLFLGACPALGATTDVRAALGMGLAVLAVMLLSGLTLSVLGKVIPQQAKIPAAILVVAGFASIVQLLMNAFLPAIYQMLGLYLAVVAVDLLILASSEEADVQGVAKALLQAFALSVTFAVLLLLTALIREALGAGSFAGGKIPFLEQYNVPVLIQPAGGFLVLSILAALIGRQTEQSFRGFVMKAAGLPVYEPAGESVEKEEAAK